MANVWKPGAGTNFGTMTWSMFPDKLEKTEIYEDPYQVEYEHRNTLKDFSSDPISFSQDLPRRSYDGYGRLTLRHTGTRSGIDPENPDLFLEFTDKDYRGHLTEIPWDEGRRHARHRKKFVEQGLYNDEDWSVPSSGLHPHTIYPKLRRAQHWTKSRKKIFSTGKDGWQHGAAVPKPHQSHVNKYQGDVENMNHDLIHQSPENRSHRTTLLSNRFHSGWRGTTDHEFKVAQYGKIFKKTPYMKHRHQTEYVRPDHSEPELPETYHVPKHLVILMNALTRETAEGAMRKKRQKATGDIADPLLAGLSGSDALEATVRGQRIAGSYDITKLLGYIQYDMDFNDSTMGWDFRKSATPGAVDRVRKLVKLVHSMPPHARLELHNRLLEQAYGAGSKLRPSGKIREQRNEIIINPKIIEFMDNATRTAKPVSDTDIKKNKRQTVHDSEKIMGTEGLENIPFFVMKSKKPASHSNKQKNKRQGKTESSGFVDIKEYSVKSYKNVIAKAHIEKNRYNTSPDIQFDDTEESQNRKNRNKPHEIANTQSTSQDTRINEFGIAERLKAPMGSKYMRRQMVTDVSQAELAEVET